MNMIFDEHHPDYFEAAKAMTADEIDSLTTAWVERVSHLEMYPDDRTRDEYEWLRTRARLLCVSAQRFGITPKPMADLHSAMLNAEIACESHFDNDGRLEFERGSLMIERKVEPDAVDLPGLLPGAMDVVDQVDVCSQLAAHTNGAGQLTVEPPNIPAIGDADFHPARKLAKEYGVDAEQLRHRLERMRKNDPMSTGCKEVANPKRGEAKFLYSRKFAMPAIDGMNEKTVKEHAKACAKTRTERASKKKYRKKTP